MGYVLATDFATSKGRVVEHGHWQGQDTGFDNRASIAQAIRSQFPNASVVGDATNTFNCHGFAHAGSHAWFNSPDLFILDDYVQSTFAVPKVGDVAVYAKDGINTHSGTVIQVSGNAVAKLRSKWGQQSVVDHAPGDVPAAYGTIKYYLRPLAQVQLVKPLGEDGELESAADNAVREVEDLVRSLVSPEHEMELTLASTFEVAHRIATSFDELVRLGQLKDVAGSALEHSAYSLILYAAAERIGSWELAVALLRKYATRPPELMLLFEPEFARMLALRVLMNSDTDVDKESRSVLVSSAGLGDLIR